MLHTISKKRLLLAIILFFDVKFCSESFFFFFFLIPLCILSPQETIKDQVANMYLWPKALEVQIMDPAK